MKHNDEYEDYDDEHNPIEDIIERLNYCRQDYYKLYKKNFKVASIRLRQDMEYIIQTAKQIKRDALSHRKQIEEKEKSEKEKIRLENEEYERRFGDS